MMNSNVFNQKARLWFEALFSDKSELQKRIYLVDIFAILNELNLYGKDQTHHASICPKRSDQSKSHLSFGKNRSKLDEDRTHMLPTLFAFLRNKTVNRSRVAMRVSVQGHSDKLEGDIIVFPRSADTICASEPTGRVAGVPSSSRGAQ